MKRSIGVLAAAALLPRGLVAPAPAADGDMSTARAGRHYLETTCAAGFAWVRYDRAVFRGRDQVTRAEVARRLKPLRVASGRLSDAAYRAARRLNNPPAAWPANVSDYVNRYQKHVLDMSNALYSQSGARNASRWMGLYRTVIGVGKKMGPLSAKIRVELNLPPRGRGC